MKFYVVLVTTPVGPSARKLSKKAVGEKLAACCSVLPVLESRYWWKGRMETSKEELLIFKTTGSKLPKLKEMIRKNHPYSVCEILALPVTDGNPVYLKWIQESLRK